jgi:hypothetical protein
MAPWLAAEGLKASAAGPDGLPLRMGIGGIEI